MEILDQVFSEKQILNYFRERKLGNMLGESLFPTRKIQDIEFDMILGKSGLPVTASVHATDTKTQLASRDAIEKGVAELALIKRQIKISEKELIKINTPRTSVEQEHAIKQLYNDTEKMVDSIRVRTEAMRMEALSSGKIKIEENGVKVTIDYKMPEGNIKAFNWSDLTTAKPLDDLTTLADVVENESGTRPTRALTSRKIVKSICNCDSVRRAIHGINSDKTVTLISLNELLVQLELPKLMVYESKYRVEDINGYRTVRYFPDDVISMFGDGTLGESIFGLTPEEVHLTGNGKMDIASMVGNIFVGKYTSIDPVAHFTKASATFLPSFPRIDELGIAKIQTP